MKRSTVSVISLLSAGFMFTMFLPWILSPNTENFTLEPISGFSFFSTNLPAALGGALLLLITLFALMKFRNPEVLLILEIEFLFLAGLLLAPAFFQGTDFFTGVLFGYYLGLAILVPLILYNLVQLLLFFKKGRTSAV